MCIQRLLKLIHADIFITAESKQNLGANFK